MRFDVRCRPQVGVETVTDRREPGLVPKRVGWDRSGSGRIFGVHRPDPARGASGGHRSDVDGGRVLTSAEVDTQGPTLAVFRLALNTGPGRDGEGSPFSVPEPLPNTPPGRERVGDR